MSTRNGVMVLEDGVLFSGCLLWLLYPFCLSNSIVLQINPLSFQATYLSLCPLTPCMKKDRIQNVFSIFDPLYICILIQKVAKGFYHISSTTTVSKTGSFNCS